MQPAVTLCYLLLGLAAGIAVQLHHGKLQAFPSQVFIHRHHTCEVGRAAECIRPRLQQRQPHNTKSQEKHLFLQTSISPSTLNICLLIHAYFLYLNYTEHSVMNHQRRVVSWDDWANQNPLHKVPRRHQNVKPVATVLYARLQNLTANGDKGVQAVSKKTCLSSCLHSKQ